MISKKQMNMSLLYVFQQQRMVVWILLLSLSWYVITTTTTTTTTTSVTNAFAIDPQVISLSSSSYSLASSSFRRTMPMQLNHRNNGGGSSLSSSSPLFSSIGSTNHAMSSTTSASSSSSTTMLRYQISSTLNEDKLTQYPWRRKNNNDQQQQHLVSNHDHQRSTNTNEFIIFCDLDGVLCDFEYGVRQIFQHEIECCHTKPFPINELKRKQVLWNRIQQSCGSTWEHNNNANNKVISGDEIQQQKERLPFFEALPWTQDGKILWYHIIQRIMKQKYQYPIHILTGCPPYSESRIEKFNWCRRELLKCSESTTTNSIKHMDMAGPLRLHIPQKTTSAVAPIVRTNNNNEPKQSVFYHNNNDENHMIDENDIDHNDDTTYVITCWSEKKYQESKPGNVLIDDRLDLKDSWESNGGIFIHHQTGNIEATIEQLIFHGIISYHDINETIIHVIREQKQQKLLSEQQHSSTTTADRSMYVW